MDFFANLSWRANSMPSDDSTINSCINDNNLIDLVGVRMINLSLRSNTRLNKFIGDPDRAMRLVSLAFGDYSREDANSFLAEDGSDAGPEQHTTVYNRACDFIGYCDSSVQAKQNFVTTVVKTEEILSVPFENLCRWCEKCGINTDPEVYCQAGSNTVYSEAELRKCLAPPPPTLIARSFQKLINLLITDSNTTILTPPAYVTKNTEAPTGPITFSIALSYFLSHYPRYLCAWVACSTSPLIVDCLRTFMSDANSPFGQLCEVSRMALQFNAGAGRNFLDLLMDRLCCLALGIAETNKNDVPVQSSEIDSPETTTAEESIVKPAEEAVLQKTESDNNTYSIMDNEAVIQDIIKFKNFGLATLYRTQTVTSLCSIFNSILICRARAGTPQTFLDSVSKNYLSNKTSYPVMVEYLVRLVFRTLCPVIPKLSIYNGPSGVIVPYIVDICISSFAMLLMGGAVICLDGILRAVYEYSYVYTRQMAEEAITSGNGSAAAASGASATANNGTTDEEEEEEEEEDGHEKVIIRHLPEIVKCMIDGAERLLAPPETITTGIATNTPENATAGTPGADDISGKWTITDIGAVNSYLTETIADFYCTVSLSEHISLSESFSRSYSTEFISALRSILYLPNDATEGQRKVRLLVSTRLLYITNDLRKLLNSHPLFSLRVIHETTACLRLKAMRVEFEEDDSHYIVFLQDILERIRKFAGTPYIKNMNNATNGYNETMDMLRKEKRHEQRRAAQLSDHQQDTATNANNKKTAETEGKEEKEENSEVESTNVTKNLESPESQESHECSTDQLENSNPSEYDTEADEDEEEDEDEVDLETPSYLTFAIALASVSSLIAISNSNTPLQQTVYASYFGADTHMTGCSGQVSLSSAGTSMDSNLWSTNFATNRLSSCYEPVKGGSAMDLVLECENIIDTRMNKIKPIGDISQYYTLQSKGDDTELKELINQYGIDSDGDTALLNKVEVPHILNICIIETEIHPEPVHDPERKLHAGSAINMIRVVNEILRNGVVNDALDFLNPTTRRTQQYFEQISARMIAGALEYVACQPSVCVNYISHITTRLINEIKTSRIFPKFNFPNSSALTTKFARAAANAVAANNISASGTASGSNSNSPTSSNNNGSISEVSGFNYPINGAEGAFLLPPKRRTGRYVLALGIIDLINSIYYSPKFEIHPQESEMCQNTRNLYGQLQIQPQQQPQNETKSYEVYCYIKQVRDAIQFSANEAIEKFAEFVTAMNEDKQGKSLNFDNSRIEKDYDQETPFSTNSIPTTTIEFYGSQLTATNYDDEEGGEVDGDDKGGNNIYTGIIRGGLISNHNDDDDNDDDDDDDSGFNTGRNFGGFLSN